MKKCFKCGEVKSLSAFYRHPMMKDGHLGKCKDCARADVSKNYEKNREHYQEYERSRFQKPERRAYVYQKMREHRVNHPDRYKARTAVGNALRDDRIKRKPCAICGAKKSESHHPDYSKPMEVLWLCKKHHWIMEGEKKK